MRNKNKIRKKKRKQKTHTTQELARGSDSDAVVCRVSLSKAGVVGHRHLILFQ